MYCSRVLQHSWRPPAAILPSPSVRTGPIVLMNVYVSCTMVRVPVQVRSPRRAAAGSMSTMQKHCNDTRVSRPGREHLLLGQSAISSAQPSVTVSVPAPPSRRADKRGHVYQWQPWIVARTRIPKALSVSTRRQAKRLPAPLTHWQAGTPAGPARSPWQALSGCIRANDSIGTTSGTFGHCDITCDITCDIMCDIDLPVSWVMMSYVKCV
jgi:hypothetical protein